MQKKTPLFLVCLLIAMAACSESGNDGVYADGDSDFDSVEAEQQEPDSENPAEGDAAEEEAVYEPWWPQKDDAALYELKARSSFFGEHAWLIDEHSSWFEDIKHEEAGETPQESSRLGYYAVGNGNVFGFVGSWYPRNTLHEMIGPGYQKRGGTGYFPDFSAMLLKDGQLLPWTRELVWKPLKAQIPCTSMQVKGSYLELDTVTFAPESDSPGAEGSAVVQLINLRNTGDVAESGIRLLLQTYDSAGETETGLRQAREGGKLLHVSALESKLLPGKSPLEKFPALLSGDLTIEPGAEIQFVVVYDFTLEGSEFSGRTAVESTGWQNLLTATADWWRVWHNAGIGIHTPDRRLDDLIEGVKGAVRVQVADNGASCPMSFYTSVWIRDSYGPTRMFLRFGYPEDAWGISDYYFKAASMHGGIANALDADSEISDPLPQLDWMGNTPFSGRLRGEGPSHIPLMHALYWRYTGQGDAIAARWEYLMHTLKGQEKTPEGLMFFSGDETFRPQLSTNLAMKGGAEYKFEDLTYSANSAFLYVRACETLAEYAEEYGIESDDVAWLRSEAERIREKTEERYWLESEERYSPFIYMDGLVPETRPAEDVNTQPIWLQYLDFHDEQARRNVISTMDMILRDNGILQNQNGDSLEIMGYKTGQGIMTGMAPAYFLYNVTDLNLDIASTTFDAVGQYVSPSGNYPEVGVFSEPGRALNLIYSRNGSGENWARHRQWEGAISAEALMHFLTGYEADVNKKFVNFAPHLPHDSGFVDAQRLMYKGNALSMHYEKIDGVYRLEIECPFNPADAGLGEFRLRLAVPRAENPTLKINGAENMNFTSFVSDENTMLLEFSIDAAEGSTVFEITGI